MTPISGWITSPQHIMAAVAAVAALVGIVYSLASKRTSRPRSTTGVIGYAVVMLWSVTALFETLSQPASTVIVAAGLVLIAVAFIVERRAQSTSRPAAQSQQSAPASRLKAQATTQAPQHRQTRLPPPPGQPIRPTRLSAAQPQPAPVKTVTNEPEQRKIKAETGERSEPLVKLPGGPRRKASSATKVILGVIVFALVTWAAYAVAKIFIEPASQELMPPEESTPAPELTPDPDGGTETDDSPEQDTVEEPAIETAPPIPRVTIEDTETGTLNVRQDASTVTPIITTINPGESYPLLDENEAGSWYKIELDDGTEGWISARYAAKSDADTSPSDTAADGEQKASE